MTASVPSDEAVQRKAFELWEARGRPHGGDKDDWHRAKALLAEVEPEGSPPSAAQVLTQGMVGVASAALVAATHMVEGLFGLAGPGTADLVSTPPTGVKEAGSGSPSDDALGDAERKLQLETDKRVRDAAMKASRALKPDQP